LTHLSPFKSKTRTFDKFHGSPTLRITPPSSRAQTSAMASKQDDDQKWTAKTVRDTFLDYFRKNGHTFGMYEK
jgi:alanyl-tRNA synthetase